MIRITIINILFHPATPFGFGVADGELFLSLLSQVQPIQFMAFICKIPRVICQLLPKVSNTKFPRITHVNQSTAFQIDVISDQDKILNILAVIWYQVPTHVDFVKIPVIDLLKSSLLFLGRCKAFSPGYPNDSRQQAEWQQNPKLWLGWQKSRVGLRVGYKDLLYHS